MDEPVSVLRVSLADKLHNLRSVATDLTISGDAEVFGEVAHPPPGSP